MIKRIFLIVLDSCGVGAAPDSAAFGDIGVNTLRSCAASPKFSIPHLIEAGLGNLDGIDYLPKTDHPTAALARLQEASMGKDTTIGHWEIAGIVSPKPLPTYPQGFPQEVLEEFEKQTGRGVLCNLPYSGTDVIRDYGEEQKKTGKWIVYTSADSVFQVAANENWIPLEELYDACRKARAILRGKHGVGRVIARPYVGQSPSEFRRTSNRHDFSLEPPKQTMLDAIKAAGLDTLAVGKIYDIFAGQGTTEHLFNKSNADGMAHTDDYAARDFRGLCFVNLVDFDMQYGHRRDVDGYANALTEFDTWLGQFLPKLGDEDLVMITADHGCDPAYTATTDHTREYVPLVVLGKAVKPVNLGSSVGISKAKDRASLRDAMDLAASFSPRILVERAVEHLREINCAVLGDYESARPSACEEPAGADEILSYRDKYLSGGKGKAGGDKGGMSSLKRRCPAEIPDEMTAEVQRLAVATFQALGCSGVARVDFLNDKETGGLWVNEINTIPGSLAFYLWEAAGTSFTALLDEMLSLAFKRAREREALTFTYESNILSGISLGGSKGGKA